VFDDMVEAWVYPSPLTRKTKNTSRETGSLLKSSITNTTV
jgi:hypothetical protein